MNIIVFVVLFGFLQLSNALTPPYKVSLLYYSGKKAPSWMVTSDNPSNQKIIEGFTAAGKAKNLYAPANIPGKVGYRGMLVKDASSITLVIGAETKGLQILLVQSAPKGKISKTLADKITKAAGTVKPYKPKGRRKRAPTYPDATWNPNLVQECNNCYNYGCDMKAPANTSFAQPGMATGRLRADPITAADCQAAAVSDHLVVTAVGPANAIPVVNPGNPPTKHLVALVVAEESAQGAGDDDYHWYRQNTDNSWSHKAGGSPVTNLDGANAAINDPRTAANDPAGPDYQFVTFMTVDSATVTIQGNVDYDCP